MENNNAPEKTIFDQQDIVSVSEEAKQFALAFDQAPDDLKASIRTLLKCSKPAP